MRDLRDLSVEEQFRAALEEIVALDNLGVEEADSHMPRYRRAFWTAVGIARRALEPSATGTVAAEPPHKEKRPS